MSRKTNKNKNNILLSSPDLSGAKCVGLEVGAIWSKHKKKKKEDSDLKNKWANVAWEQMVAGLYLSWVLNERVSSEDKNRDYFR